MKRLLLLLLLFAPAFGQVETLSVDGIYLDSLASKQAWLPNPCPDGSYTAGDTTVQVRSGKIISVTGTFLSMGHHQLAAVGQPIAILGLTLGNPTETLYGCGPQEGEHVRFYNHLGVTVCGGEKVTQVRLEHVKNP
ncbi:MAG: hypothetical protein KC910_21405 [Candidatus Eremiobacteraeota bacterium]|nr:hypothetical protein [Candidatus Eremiobacteraeota bacterium]